MKITKIERDAVLSLCGRYRYILTRRWGGGEAMVWVMLNPSTADAYTDDATIRKCMGFAQREGVNAIEVVNLYAYRATKPMDLFTADDPVGPDNDDHIYGAVYNTKLVVCAWGNNARQDRKLAVLNILRQARVQPKCLGVTKQAMPAHPLMLSYVRKLKAFGWTDSSEE